MTAHSCAHCSGIFPIAPFEEPIMPGRKELSCHAKYGKVTGGIIYRLLQKRAAQAALRQKLRNQLRPG